MNEIRADGFYKTNKYGRVIAVDGAGRKLCLVCSQRTESNSFQSVFRFNAAAEVFNGIVNSL